MSALASEELNGAVPEEWVSYFMEKHALWPITLKEAPPELTQRVVRTEGQSSGRLGTQTFEHEMARIALPIEPNENINDLIGMVGLGIQGRLHPCGMPPNS